MTTQMAGPRYKHEVNDISLRDEGVTMIANGIKNTEPWQNDILLPLHIRS